MPKIKDDKTDAQIHQGRREKLRQSYEKYGLETFNETQVLEFALGMVMPRIDTNPLAHRLIDAFGSLNGVIGAHPDKIRSVAGAGVQVAFFLSFLKQFVTYYANTSKKDEHIITPNDAIESLRAVMKTYPTEYFVIVALDKTGAVLLRHSIRGSIDKVDINLRDIADAVLRVHSSSIFFAHNHLDGHVTPSDADMRLTRAMVNVFLTLGIDVMDHIIFGKDTEYSFARAGIIDIFKREHKAFVVSKDYEDLV